MKRPTNTLILTTEPFVGFMPEDLRSWLRVYDGDGNLAQALAAVSNHTGDLGHEMGESEDYWLLYTYDAWSELEKEICEMIRESLKRSNQDRYTEYDLSEQRLYYLVKPFMEQNGFRDGSGWWILKEE